MTGRYIRKNVKSTCTSMAAYLLVEDNSVKGIADGLAEALVVKDNVIDVLGVARSNNDCTTGGCYDQGTVGNDVFGDFIAEEVDMNFMKGVSGVRNIEFSIVLVVNNFPGKVVQCVLCSKVARIVLPTF